MPDIYKTQFLLTDRDIDANGHLNNVVYVQWMQDIAILHSSAQGFTNEKYHELESTWFVRSHFVEYLSPAFAGDTIEAYTWVTNFKKIRALRKYKFIRASDQVTLAWAETDWIYVSAKTGRPQAIPEDFKNAFRLVPVEEEP